MTDKGKIVMEMAEHIREYVSQQNNYVHLNGKWANSLHKIGIAEHLYDAGYRKESEFAREIFEKIEREFSPVCAYAGYAIKEYLADLKKKYIGENNG